MGHDDAVSKVCWRDGRLYSASWDSTVKVCVWICYTPAAIYSKHFVIFSHSLALECIIK